MASYLDFGFDTFLRVKIQKVGVIDAVYVPAISSDVVVDTSSIPVESISEVYLNNDGLKVKDTDATHGLTIQPGSNLTADRTLTVTTGDSNRTITLNGDVVLPGGTLTPSNGGIVYSTDTALAVLAGTATAGQHLQSGASSAPSWTTATYPATTTANQLLYSSATNTITGLATAASSVLVTNGSSVPSLSTDIPTAVTIGSAYIYRASGTDVPVTDGGTGASDASTARSNLGLGSISTQASNNVSISGGSVTGITDLTVADGGTGVSTLTGLVKGSGSSAFTAVTAPSGTVVGDTDTITLTNKTIDNPTLKFYRQDNTSNSLYESNKIQIGWGFILNDGTTTSTKTVTFPNACTHIPIVLISCVGEKDGSDPTGPDGHTFALTDSVTTVVAAKSVSSTSFVAEAQRTPASNTIRTVYTWIAIG